VTGFGVGRDYKGDGRHRIDIVDVAGERGVVLQIGLQRARHDCARIDQRIAHAAIFPADAAGDPSSGVPFPAYPLGGQRFGDGRLRLRRHARYFGPQWRRLAHSSETGIVIVHQVIGARLAITVIEGGVRQTGEIPADRPYPGLICIRAFSVGSTCVARLRVPVVGPGRGFGCSI